MRAAACALLGLLAACSQPSRSASQDGGASLGVDPSSGLLHALAEGHAATHVAGAAVRDGDAGQGSELPTQVDAGATPVQQPLTVTALAGSGSRHQLRVSALRGRARCDMAPLALDTQLGDGALLQLERGAQVTLALDDYVRLELFGPLLARVLPSGQPALLLREGALSLDVAPRGLHGTHSAFWLATPLGKLDVADSARLVVRASSKGAGELAVISGHALLARADQALALRAGAAHCVAASTLTELSRPFATLEQAVATLTRGPSCAGRAGSEPGQRERALEGALDAVQQREQGELSLLAEHTHLVAVEDPRAQVVRSQLASSAGVLLHDRAWAMALRAQVEAQLLGHKPTSAQARLLERANQLAPYRD